MTNSTWIWIGAAALGGALAARGAEPGALTLDTERVVVFKDGHGLVVKRARGVVAPDGTVFTDAVPDSAVLGCFWASAADGTTLGMRAGWHERREEQTAVGPCLSVHELLRANVGKTLSLIRRDQEPIDGRIVELLEASPEAPGGHASAPLVVVDRGNQGRIALPVAQVVSLSGPELVTTVERRRVLETRTKRLSFDCGSARAGEPFELTLMYFSEGLRWIPTYRVDLASEDRARVSLQGEVLNELEDFEDVQLELVVGVPNFRFQGAVSPLVLEQSLRGLLQQAAPGLHGQQALSNAMYSQRASERVARSPAAPDTPAELSGADGNQDLFVYRVGAFSLARGARASVPLWDHEVAYRHVYTLDVHVARNARSGGWSVGGREASPLQLARNEVWHQVELVNASQVPWTTGAALVTRGGVPLGQELLTYTSVGGCTLLPITVAVNLRARYQEEELARSPNALTWSGHAYGLVQKRGTVELANFGERPASLRVRLSLGGKITQASGEGSTRLNDYRPEDWADSGYGTVNNHSDRTWELTLRPGEDATLSAEFEFYLY